MTDKIELHVHFEGTVRPQTLLDIARRNHEPLPVAGPQAFDATPPASVLCSSPVAFITAVPPTARTAAGA